ncbi:hypothetical protein [Rhizobium sp. IBUN]|uniref:hypothetical protein n=1 Tax=Rhizobium sp. IBUN TaxID=1042326 RepID=UPI00041805CC|nr:hypothetical protein [Rhizobium sp. IBUN]
MPLEVRKGPSEYEAGELSYPIKVMPGEGLADLLFRASAENGYVRTSVVLALAGLGGQKRTHLALAGKAIDPERIAFMIGLSSSKDIEALAYPATRSANTHFEFFGREVRGKSFFQSFRKIAPTSLRQQCYQKALWAVRGITFDPSTREQLLFQCPICKELLSYAKSHGVENCSACYAIGRIVDLRDFPQPSIEVDDEEALRLFITLIDPAINVADLDLSKVPDAIRTFGPGAVFELISNIARSLSRYREHGSASRDLLLQYRTPFPDDIAKATRAVMSWPEGLNLLHERMLNDQRTKLETTGEKQNGRVHPPIRQIVSLLDRDFQRLLLSKLHEERRRLAFKSLASITAKSDCARTQFKLSISPLFRSGGTNGLRRANGVTVSSRKEDAFVKLSDARYVMLSSSETTRSFAKHSGIPVPFLVDLFAGNFIEVLDHAIDPYLGRSHRPPDMPFEKRILLCASHREMPSLTLPLGAALSALSGRRINPFVMTLDAMLQGSLEFWHGQEKGPLMTRLRVRDFDMLRSILEVAEVAGHIDDLPVENRTACAVMGLGYSALVRLHNTHLLQRHLSMKNLWLFHEMFIMAPEITRRAAMNGHVLKHHKKFAGELKVYQVVGRGTAMIYERQVVEEHFGKRLACRA